MSIADCSVIELSVRENATILSADGRLRKVSEKMNLKVVGTVGLIETMNFYKVLDSKVSIQLLERYKRNNPRSPKVEIENSINKLKEGVQIRI